MTVRGGLVWRASAALSGAARANGTAAGLRETVRHGRGASELKAPQLTELTSRYLR